MERLGPYVVVAPLGRGGAGSVHRAAHADTGQEVALKRFEGVDARARLRFRQEAEALRRLRHPNVVAILDAGEEGGRPWLALELVPGGSLQDHLDAAGRLRPRAAVGVALAVARGLAHAHAQGVLHRDLKPANVLLSDDGRPRLTDFGLAAIEDATERQRLTVTGTFLGTPGYWSPEQAAGRREEVGPPTDIYGLGATLYAALTGRPPVRGDDLAEVLRATEHLAPDPPGVDARLDALVLRCLAKRPADRFASADDLAAALQAWLEQGSRARRPRGAPGPRRALGLAGLGLAGLGALAALAVRAERAAAPPPSLAPAPAPAPADGAPWGPAPAGWLTTWRLADAPATPDAPALWPAPDTVAPLEAVTGGAPAALAAAYAGAARVEAGGRVRVAYGREALRARREASVFLTLDPALAARPALDPDGLAAFSPNDGGSLDLVVGGARWTEGRIDLVVQELVRIDTRHVGVRWFGAAGAGPELNLEGRAGRLTVAEAPGSAERGSRPFAFEAGPARLAFAPWAARDRVLLDDAPAPDLAAGAGWRPAAGPAGVLLHLGEVHAAFPRLEVGGVPARVDRSALARPPGAAGASPGPAGVRIAGAFEGAPGAASGPALALGDVLLERTAGRLALTLDGELLAAADVAAPGAAGWLALERRGRLLVGAAGPAAEGAGAVEVVAACPFVGPGPPGFGSTGARVRWTAVEVAAGAAAPAAGETDWVAGARDLARLASPDPDPGLARSGAAPAAARLDLAARAAGALEAAGLRLEGALARDARARAVLARILAGDEARALEALGALRRADGLDEALRAVDGLLRGPAGEPELVERLVAGWHLSTRADPGVRAAALSVALVLAPARRAEVLFQQGEDARQADDPAAALACFEAALAAGAERSRLLPFVGASLKEQGRLREALAAYDEALALTPRDSLVWCGKAEALSGLGRQDEAVEAALGAVATSPGRGTFRALLAQFAGRRPASAVMLAARVALDRAAGPAVEAEARALRPTAPRDQDLVAYLLGQDPPPGDRPTRALALARRGDPAALAGLEAAGRADPLVAHLARLDPSLAR